MQPNEHQSMVIGGNLSDALKGRYSLSLTNIAKLTLTTTKNHWIPLLLGFGAFIGLLMVLSLAANAVWPGFIQQIAEQQQSAQSLPLHQTFALIIVASAIVAPFFGGLLLMGIRHSVDIPTRSVEIFNGFKRAGPLILVYVLSVLITQLLVLATTQLHLFIGLLVHFYLTVAFAFAVPLVVERQLSPLNALYYSVRIANYKLPQYFILLFVVVVLLAISAVLSFIPLLIVVPLIFNLFGVVYKEVVGVTIRLDEDDPNNNNDDPQWKA